jgi:hypothetical protein
MGQRAGILGGFGDWLQQHSNTLLAISAGLSGAPGIHAGIGRAAAYTMPAAQQDIAEQMQRGGVQASFNALMSAGVPRDLAMAGATNPKIMDKLMDTYITGNKYTIHDVTKTDSWGQKTSTPIAVNERDPSDAYYIETGEQVHPSVVAGKGPQTGTLIQGSNGQPIVVPQPGGGGGGGGGGGPPSQQQQSQFYAPGIDDSTFDHTKVGDDYLQQFSPEAQAEIKNRTMGAAAGGFGRGKPEVLQRLQMAADKYGQDMGLPMDPVSLSQRRVWANSLADTNSGVGLQAKGFKQGLEHLANITDKWVKLNQYPGMGFEPVARAENFTVSSKRQAIVNGLHSDAQKFGGEVNKLFSKGGTGSERGEAAKSVGDERMSRIAAAGALEAALDQMYGGLRPLEGQRDALFPPGTAPRGSDFVGKAEQANIARIRRNIAILRGEKPASPAASTSGTSGGLKWSVVPQ